MAKKKVLYGEFLNLEQATAKLKELEDRIIDERAAERRINAWLNSARTRLKELEEDLSAAHAEVEDTELKISHLRVRIEQLTPDPFDECRRMVNDFLAGKLRGKGYDNAKKVMKAGLWSESPEAKMYPCVSYWSCVHTFFERAGGLELLKIAAKAEGLVLVPGIFGNPKLNAYVSYLERNGRIDE